MFAVGSDIPWPLSSLLICCAAQPIKIAQKARIHQAVSLPSPTRLQLVPAQKVNNIPLQLNSRPIPQKKWTLQITHCPGEFLVSTFIMPHSSPVFYLVWWGTRTHICVILGPNELCSNCSEWGLVRAWLIVDEILVHGHHYSSEQKQSNCVCVCVFALLT